MFAQGYIDIAKDNVIATLQEQVGLFFTLKSRLLKLRRSNLSPGKRADIEKVLARQIEAEPRVQRALGVLGRISRDGVSAVEKGAGLFQISPAVRDIKRQLEDVNRLERGQGLEFTYKDIPWKWVGGAILGLWVAKRVL